MAQTQKTSWKFDFGSGKVADGYVQVLPTTLYTAELGYGFEPGATVQAIDRGGNDPLKGDFCTSDKPFQFSVAVPEGNYQVAVTLGDPDGESKTTIKAESRRLMVEKAHLDKGKIQTYTFCVNVRTPQIPSGGVVRLKDREKAGEARAWDDKLTLEFDDVRPCVSAIEIKKVDNLPVVYVCGDSTVCDQPGENYASWGQMLPRFFKPDVVVANHGESGESLRGFLGEKRWDKIMSLLKPGDYVIVQMGHNDEKERGEGVGAMTSYKRDLKRFVADARSKGATPIIVSPMERRNFDGAKIKPSHNTQYGDVPEAVRQVAKEDRVAFVDLTALSVTFYETLGPEKAYLAFAGSGPQRDATHHDNYGAYELAKCIVQGIRDNKLDLAKHIADDFQGFDPAKPDSVEGFVMPAGPQGAGVRPLGS
jgi:lysophospholipase L1-like esterase